MYLCKFKNVLTWIINILLICIVLLISIPIKSIFGIDISKYVLISYFMLAMFLFVMDKQIKTIVYTSIHDIFVFLFILIWLFFGLFNGYTIAINFFNGLVIPLITFIITYYLYKFNFIQKKKMMCTLCIALALFLLEKLFFEFTYIFKIFSYDEIRNIYFNVFNSNIITMTFNIGNLTLIRLQSSTDCIFYTMLPILLVDENIKNNVKIVLLVLSTLFTIIVFSRIYIVHFVSILILCLILNGKLLYKNFISKFDKKKLYILGSMSVVLLIILISNILEPILVRFLEDGLFSDSIRNEQAIKLFDGFKEHPLIGHGMGSYLSEYVRSQVVPYSYEKEYISFLYQFGVIGFILVIVGTMSIYIGKIYFLMKKKTTSIKLCIYLSLLWYMLRPLFNPSFIGLSNNFIFIVLLIYLNFSIQEEVDTNDISCTCDI